jgi:hypothetical protein
MITATGKRWLKEFEAGKQSGLKHLDSSVLYQENLRKMELGLKDEEYPLVRAYWKGYRTGMELRNE